MSWGTVSLFEVIAPDEVLCKAARIELSLANMHALTLRPHRGETCQVSIPHRANFKECDIFDGEIKLNEPLWTGCHINFSLDREGAPRMMGTALSAPTAAWPRLTLSMKPAKLGVGFSSASASSFR